MVGVAKSQRKQRARKRKGEVSPSSPPLAQTLKCAMAIPIFDGHNDAFLKLYRGERGDGASFLERSSEGHLDLERAKEGDFAGGFFALFSPSDEDLEAGLTKTPEGYTIPLSGPRDPALALEDTLAMAAELFRTEAASKGEFKVVRTVGELRECLDKDVMAAIFHIEGAEALDTDLDRLTVLYQAGLRSVGIVWSRPNTFGTGVPFSFPAHPDIGPGLTDAGKRLVKACNHLGVMLDLSHLNAKGFWDVAELSDAPLVATHSNAYALSHSPRNLTDEQLTAIRASDGMVGLNFAVAFLREDGQRVPETGLDVMVRHVDYLVDKLGIDRVGLGSDFDGATIPKDLSDVTGLPNLVEALRDYGFDQEGLEKLCYKNWLRVLEKTWRE